MGQDKYRDLSRNPNPAEQAFLLLPQRLLLLMDEILHHLRSLKFLGVTVI